MSSWFEWKFGAVWVFISYTIYTIHFFKFSRRSYQRTINWTCMYLRNTSIWRLEIHNARCISWQQESEFLSFFLEPVMKRQREEPQNMFTQIAWFRVLLSFTKLLWGTYIWTMLLRVVIRRRCNILLVFFCCSIDSNCITSAWIVVLTSQCPRH